MRNISAAGETITRLLDNLLPVGEKDATGIVFQPETKKLVNVYEDMLRQMRLDAGLGLSIVLAAVEALHGTIQVESQRGCGAAFVTLSASPVEVLGLPDDLKGAPRYS